MTSPPNESLNPSPYPADPWRLFIAVETNEPMQQTVARVQRTLQQRGELPVRWTASAQTHLTLQFYGNVVAMHVPALIAAIGPAVVRCPLLLLRAGEVGAFPSLDAPRVLWLDMRGEVERLIALQRAVAAASQSVAGIVAERKPFRPHLTLGRVRIGHRDMPGMHAVAGALARPVPVPATGWPVSSVALIRSVLGAGGSRYTVLERFPLDTGMQAR